MFEFLGTRESNVLISQNCNRERSQEKKSRKKDERKNERTVVIDENTFIEDNSTLVASTNSRKPALEPVLKSYSV